MIDLPAQLNAALMLGQASAEHMVYVYAAFIGLVLVFLALDLGVFNRKDHVVSPREAIGWSVVWASCAMAFAVFVYFAYGGHWFELGLGVPVVGNPSQTETISGAGAVEQFLAGYIVEWSLSVDNLFVIAVILRFFAVPAQYQHRVLFWGILGALVMRGGMIALGAVLLHKFGWITYVFGGVLLLTAVKMAFAGEEHVHPDRNILVRLVRRVWPVSSGYDGRHFFTRVPGAEGGGRPMRRAVTPLLLALLVVEFTDVVFAVDSVPAVFAITGDPFLVLTSNVFAIMGLRSLYFLLASMLGQFRYLKHALVLILGLVGVKMLLVHTHYKIGTTASLLVVLGLLGAGVGASLVHEAVRGRRERRLAPRPAPVEDLAEAAALARKNFRKILILIAGTAVILFGVAIAPLPGPGPTILIPVGLAILATEFFWAQRLLRILKERTEKLAQQGDAAGGAKIPRWFLVPIVIGFYGFFLLLYIVPRLSHTAVIGFCCGLSLPLWWWVYRVMNLTRPPTGGGGGGGGGGAPPGS